MRKSLYFCTVKYDYSAIDIYLLFDKTSNKYRTSNGQIMNNKQDYEEERSKQWVAADGQIS